MSVLLLLRGAGYRRLLVADAQILVDLWNDPAVRQGFLSQGYVLGAPMTSAALADEMARPRHYWLGAFGPQGVLRAAMELIYYPHAQPAVWIPRFFWDPSLGVQAVREHRDAISKKLWAAIPDGFLVHVPGIRNTAPIVREYCDAKFQSSTDDGDERSYTSTVEHLRSVA